MGCYMKLGLAARIIMISSSTLTTKIEIVRVAYVAQTGNQSPLSKGTRHCIVQHTDTELQAQL